ncbi:hypothetical protein [Paracoccus litorisediminis]|uniref:Uncharacterized protein n=1 Tax=Paracoccus litorisediminis TaxID=2006130 RepID=A0A844HS10_9RHOB|nr:hypothetical protein [Paracoccus litorisediminis]MTH61224.1 hypothetical protein [Paracoccus litorisediminis]
MLDLRSTPYENQPNVTLGDVLTFRYVPDKLRKFERDLFTTKWWDYRFMTPIEATQEFIAAYRPAARVVYSRLLDYQRGQHISPLLFEDFIERLENPKQALAVNRKSLTSVKADFTGHWRARQVADAIGIPYRTFIEFMLAERLGCWDRAALPGPAHLYSSIGAEKMVKHWNEVLRTRMHYAEHYAYMPENYRRAPAQTAYVEWLVGQARLRPFDLTMRSMIDAGKISVEGLRHVLGADEVERLLTSRSH